MTAAEWETSILEDIASFRDLGTEVDVRRLTQSSAVVVWRQGGRAREATFSLEGSDVLAEYQGRKRPYGEFLAGPHMADLRNLALSIERYAGEVWFKASEAGSDPGAGLESIFVPVRIREQSNSVSRQPEEADGLSYLSDLNDGRRNEDGVTLVTFFLADAGQGKSQLLRRACVHEAERFLRGETSSLMLYVDAQGSGLAMLHQAVAASLDDYRSGLIYQNVQSLVREGLLVLVIDGFDELLSTPGTSQDAFSSLSAFVGSLHGQGSVVASGRSAYYEHEFATRAARFGVAGHDVRSVLLLDWGQEEYFRYVQEVAELRRVDVQPLKQPWYSHPSLLGKPFFAREVVSEMLRGNADIVEAGPADIVDRIVHGYLARETGKLLRDGQSVLTTDEIARFYQEISEEMWRLETRELDPPTLRALAELVFEDLDERALDMVVQRAPYLALLTVGNQDIGTVRFEHEIFYSYFVSRMLSRIVSVDKEGYSAELSMLEHALVPKEAAEFVAQRWANQPLSVAVLARVFAGAGMRSGRRRPIVRENAGILLATLARHSISVSDAVLEGVVFKGLSLAGVEMTGCRFDDVHFESCDLAETRFERCTASDVTLTDVAVSEGTLLQLEGLRWDEVVRSLRVHEEDRVRSVYDPGEIADRLRQLGFPGVPDDSFVAREVSAERIELVGALAQAYSRTNLLGERHGDWLRLTEHDDWPQVLGALEANGLVVTEVRAVSGPKQTFYRRRFDPAELMRGRHRTDTPGPVADFWRDLETP